MSARFIAIVSVLYLGFMYILYIKFGWGLSNEAAKYIHASESLSYDTWMSVWKDYSFYFSFILFIKFFHFFLTYTQIIIVQIVLSWLGSIALYDVVYRLTSSTRSSRICMVLFLFCYPIQYWTITLYSESFTISICLFQMYCMFRSRTIYLFLFLFFSILLIFARPVGILITMISCICWMTHFFSISYRKLGLIYGIVMLLFFVCILFVPLDSTRYLYPILSRQVILYSDTFNNHTLLPKDTLYHVYRQMILDYGWMELLKLFVQKLISFFTLTRFNYSRISNAILASYYLYYLAGFGGLLYGIKNHKEVGLYLVAIIIGLATMVGMTYNEWHVRFTTMAFPYIIVLIGLGYHFGIERKDQLAQIQH